MKITERLVGDHKTFQRMIRDLDALADQPPGQREARKLIRLVELFKDHLMLHAWAEDRFYYPLLRSGIAHAPAPISTAYMDHLDEEHKTVDGYLARLEEEVKAGVATWPQTYALFSKGLAAHMRKEEGELFPLSEQWLGAERLEEASQELERRRSEAPRVRRHLTSP